MGGKSSTISTSEPRIGALRIQQSTYGLPLFVVWGANRVPGNLIDYNNFRTIAVTTTTTSGGKGGGGKVKQSDTKYEYYAAPIMALGEGPVASIQTVWRGKTKIVGGALTGSKTTTEVAVIPSNGIVRPAFYGYWTAGVSVARCAGGADATDAALTSGTDYTVAAGVYTFAAAHVGRTVRIVYTWTPPAWMTAADVSAGFTLFRGDVGQAPWSYMSTSYPAKALAYSHTAYVAAQSYRLTDSAEVENHSFEVNGRLQYPGLRDANPADIAADALTNPQFGASFPGGRLGDLTTYSTFCRASGIFLSPALTEQTQAGEFLSQLAKMTNSALVWSEGKLKIIPYGDAPLSANGAVYSPNLTPIYDLTDDDFQRESDGDPVKCNRKTTADAFNQVQVEFLNRANDYNVEIAEAKDQANIEQFGLRTAEPVEMHWITDAQVATYVSNLILQRGLYVRNEYTFRLGWKYALLEPMDLVTLTDAKLDVAKIPVRIISIDENEWGDLTVVAEDFPAGVASAALYPPTSTDGFFPDFAANPGAVTTPAFFEPPASLTGGALQVWCAVSGSGANWGGCSVWCSTDGTNYKRVGAIYGGSRYGTLTASLAAAPGGSAAVQLDGKGGQILSGSSDDARSLATLCWIGGELVAHTTATLTAPNAYTLALGVRGAYQTPDGVKASGARFVRLDDALGKSDSLPLSMLGSPLYFKFTSFNTYSAGEQSLSDVTAYTHIVGDNLGTAAYTLQDGLTGPLPTVGVGVNFVSNPNFEFNESNAPTVTSGDGPKAVLGAALADGWQVGTVSTGTSGSTLFNSALTSQSAFVSSGKYSLNLSLAAGGVVPNDGLEKAIEAFSTPIYVAAGQKYSLRSAVRTYNTASPGAGVTVGQRVSVAYYDSTGAEMPPREVSTCPVPNNTFVPAELNARTVPSGCVYIRVICTLWIKNSGASAYTIPSGLLYGLFDNFYGAGISASDVVLLDGQSVEQAVSAISIGKASVSAVQTLEARVSVQEGVFGVNLWLNPSLAIDSKFWCVLTWNSHSDPNYLYGRNLEGAGYQVAGTNYYEIRYNGTPAADKYMAVYQDRIAVLPSTDYYISGMIGMSGFAEALLGVEAFDAAGVSLGQVAGLTGNTGKAGGTNRANWQPVSTKITTASTARFLDFFFRTKTNTNANPRAFLMEPMIERATPAQAAPSAYNTGPVTAWAKWDVSFNVDGYISGITLASDGRSTAFAVAADVFQVRAPSGADALTWQAGVLSSRKGSKEMKLGPGFGADPSGKRMILSYGNPVADASATRATADVFIAENGDTKFGGFQLNYGSAWKTGAAITYTAAAGTPATATISVTAGTFAIGSRSYAYDASSVGVTGTNGTSVTYFLYYDDPGLLAGACTLYASTDPTVTYTSDSKVLVGQVKVVYPASGSGSGGGSTPGGGGGGGGGNCVSVRAWVITRAGPVRAGSVVVGDELLLCDPETGSEVFGVVTYSARMRVPGVRMYADDAVLTCSETAPIPTDKGYLPAPETLGRALAVRGAGGVRRACVVSHIETAGAIDVQHITVGDRCFWAGDTETAYILHHNLKSIPDV